MTSSLEPDREERLALAEEVVAYLNEQYDRHHQMDASGADLDPDVLATFRRPPPEEGRPLTSILADLDTAGLGGVYHPSGGHMSYIPNAGLYSAALAELLAAGLNRYTGIVHAAPGFSAIEHGVVEWLTSLFRLGPASSGLLLSGGSMANLTGIVTARNAILGDDFTTGVIYLTRHTHHSVAKAARIAGFRPDQIVEVGVDTELRIDLNRLTEQIASDRAAGRRPFLIVVSAGTTDTGTVDPLADAAAIASGEEMWLHVDAAYGGVAAMLPSHRHVLAGPENSFAPAVGQAQIFDVVVLSRHRNHCLRLFCIRPDPRPF